MTTAWTSLPWGILYCPRIAIEVIVEMDDRPSSRPLFGYLTLTLDCLIAWLSVCWSTLRFKTLLRMLGCRYGRKLRVDGRTVVRVRNAAAITIGDHVSINSRFMANLAGMTNPTVFQCIDNGSIHIGDDSGCSATVFSSRASIHVGRQVKIGSNVRIYDHDFHSLDHLRRREAAQDGAGCTSAPVVIGDDVFIGANAVILKGVAIGDRSVIGAGAVVSLKSIPPDSLVGGNPARIIKSLK